MTSTSGTPCSAASTSRSPTASPPTRPARMLDWGCGFGQMTALLRERGLEVEAFDYRPAETESGPRPLARYPEITAYIEIADPVALPYPDDGFDAVLSCGVLEHVSAPEASLAEIRRVLRPGGTFYVYKLPNRRSYLEAIAKRIGLYYHGAWPDDRVYDLPGARSLLERGGFAVREARLANLLPLTVGGEARGAGRGAAVGAQPRARLRARACGSSRRTSSSSPPPAERAARPLLSARERRRGAGRRRRRCRSARRASGSSSTHRPAATRSGRPPGNRHRPATAYCSVPGSPTLLVDVSSATSCEAGAAEQRAQSGVGEVRPVARQVQVEPAIAEPPRLPVAEVRDRHDHDPARRQRGADALQVGERLGRVLERVLEDHEVERARLQLDGRQRALAHVDAAGARRRAGGGRRLDAGHPPSAGDQQRGEVAASAADVEAAARRRARRPPRAGSAAARAGPGRTGSRARRRTSARRRRRRRGRRPPDRARRGRPARSGAASCRRRTPGTRSRCTRRRRRGAGRCR